MRILQILPELNVGGVETGTVDFAKYLKEHGHYPVVVSNGGDLVRELTDRGIHHYRLPVHHKNPFSALSCIRKLREIILEEHIDIVHARSRVPAWIAFFACRKTPAQFITTCHGHYSVQFFSRIMSFSKLVIVPSNVIGRHMMEAFHVPAEHIRCIPRSVDLTRFNIEREDHTGQNQIVTIVGRLTPLKGHVYFLKAMAKLVRSMPYVKVLIVGDAPKKKESYRKELEVLTRHLGLSEHVEFLGRRKDVPQIMAASDVVVMSSIEPEAFGRVIIEAQAVGTPVVATNVGGIVEVLEHEKTGLLVLPKDPDAMANAVMRLLNEKKFAKEMAARARKHLEENYTLDRMAGQTISVYEELMEQLNLLVIKMTALGDVVLITASLKALRRSYPRARICCLVDESCKDILRKCPYLDELIVIDLKGRDRGPLGILKAGLRLTGYHFDKVIDFQNNQKSHLLAAMTFAPHIYGYRNKKLGFLVTDPVVNPDHDLPPVEHQFKVLNLMGIKPDPEDLLEIYPSSTDVQKAQALLDSEWVSSGMKLVGINLSASLKWKTKNWPLKKMARLCDLMAAENVRVMITGTGKDKETADELMRLTKSKPANFVGRTKINELAVLIRRCDVYITPDSSPMHLAAAVGTPFIALFGPTSAKRHLPPNRSSIVIQRKMDCAPCYNARFCRILNHACMEDIREEEVFEAVKKLINRK
ncbi:MAG: GT4 family glycosyltransferase PelF [Candidatus Omnitrophota bacterium]